MVFTVDPALAFRNFQLLKLKYDKLVSNFAFNCKLRHYIEDWKVCEKRFSNTLPGFGGAVQVDPALTPDSPRLV